MSYHRCLDRDKDGSPARRLSPRRSIWTARETATFLEAVEDDGLHALWRLLVVTGVRRGEVCGLTWLNVDLDVGTITIAQQLVPVGGELVFQPPKTAAGLRSVPIDAVTVTALKRHHETQLLERQVVGDPDIDRDLVFTN